jgi:serine/threonine protein kinase
VLLLSYCWPLFASFAGGELPRRAKLCQTIRVRLLTRLLLRGSHRIKLTNQGLSLPGYLEIHENLDFRCTREVARGGLGIVFLADALSLKTQDFGKVVIAKKFKPTVDVSAMMPGFLQEVSIMEFLSENSNIARIIGFSTSPPCIVMKYYQTGSLKSWLDSSDTKTRPIVLRFMQDISAALQAMHSQGLAHCDVKLDNILIDVDKLGNLYGVLTDFGISQVTNNKILLVHAFNVRNVVGASISFASPECLRYLKSSK